MTRAFSICGNMVCGTQVKPTVAVLFLPESVSETALKHNNLCMKTLRRLGFESAGMVEQATYAGKPHDEPTLYYFHNVRRGPSQCDVFVEKLSVEGGVLGKNGGPKLVPGDPHIAIPPVSGSIWESFIKPRDGLSAADFHKPKQGTGPQSSTAAPQPRQIVPQPRPITQPRVITPQPRRLPAN